MNRNQYINSVYETYFKIEIDYLNAISNLENLFRSGNVNADLALKYYILHQNFNSFKESSFNFIERLKYLDL